MPQLSFQQGVNGYTGTFDTMLRGYRPTLSYAEAASVSVDSDDRNDLASQVLLRFSDIFGSGSGQIPLGAQIISATLTLQTTNIGSTNDTGSGAKLHRMLASWSETDTWDKMGDGVQADGT